MYEHRAGKIKKLTPKQAEEVVLNRTKGMFYCVQENGKYLAFYCDDEGTFQAKQLSSVSECKAWLREEMA